MRELHSETLKFGVGQQNDIAHMFRRRHVDSAHALSRNSTHLPNKPVDFACFVLASGQFWIVEYSRIVHRCPQSSWFWELMCCGCRPMLQARVQGSESRNKIKSLKTSTKNQRWTVEGFHLAFRDLQLHRETYLHLLTQFSEQFHNVEAPQMNPYSFAWQTDTNSMQSRLWKCVAWM